jgi:hypothetical protein
VLVVVATRRQSFVRLCRLFHSCLVKKRNGSAGRTRQHDSVLMLWFGNCCLMSDGTASYLQALLFLELPHTWTDVATG